MFKKIRWRILITILILIITSMVILGVALIWPLQNYFLNNLKDNLTKKGILLSQTLVQEVASGNYEEVDIQVKDLGKKVATRITIVLPDGTVIADSEKEPNSMENHKNRSEIKNALNGSTGFKTRYSTTLKTEMMYVAVPMKYEGKIASVTRLSVSLTETNKIISKLRGILITGILIAIFLVILLSLKLTKGLTRPLEAISNGTKKISQGDLDVKIYTGTDDEIGELANAINDMAKNLKEKITEISLEKSKLESILNTILSGVIVLDSKGLIKVINPAAEEILGINRVTSIGKHNLEVIRNPDLNKKILESIKNEKIIEHEFSITYPENRIIQCYIAPVYRENKVSGVTVVFHDITRIRRLEQIRADFVANASHELRTPLTAIKGYAETLLDGALNDQKVSKKFLKIIDQESDRMIKLVEDLLNLSKIEKEKYSRDVEKLNVVDLINSTVEEMRFMFSEKNISLNVNIPEKVSFVKINKNKFKQVLVNLLDNALKYTSEGGFVTVEVIEESHFVKILVKDTGVGIPEKDISRIFERFYRVDKARTRSLGGFGLGLAIVKHIVESFGGRIGVESKENNGSVFWFTIPKAK